MIGARLGSWVIDKELGHGGMGDVYLAHEVNDDDRLAAVKVLAGELARDPGFLQRFQREIDVLRQLDHPGIVQFYESGEHEERPYYVMEYIEGQNFEELLQEQGRLPWREVLDMAVRVCPPLKHAHDRGIVHRDIKPSNLLRTTTGDIKLTDFGIAKVFSTTHLTATGGIVGTAEYLSPEQATGKPATKRSDLYSLGVVLYALLTGRPPFQGGSVADLLHKHCFGQFDHPRTLVPEIPYDLDEVVCLLLEKDPARRPGDALALQRQLDSVRRKLSRQDGATISGEPAGGRTVEYVVQPPSSGPGPATLMSRLMREELDRQNRGGPVKQFLNKPLVLVLLFLVCVSLIAWTFWPASAESMFRRGEALMAKDDPDKWDEAWRDYLQPLNEKHPDHPYQDQVEVFHRRILEHEALRKAARGARPGDPATEAQWFYQEGVRLRVQGKDIDARRVWENLIRAFRDVPSEHSWVDLAQRRLKETAQPRPTDDRSWAIVRETLQHARKLKEQGKQQQAEEVWQGVEELYKGDPSAAAILKAVQQDRGR